MRTPIRTIPLLALACGFSACTGIGTGARTSSAPGARASSASATPTSPVPSPSTSSVPATPITAAPVVVSGIRPPGPAVLPDRTAGQDDPVGSGPSHRPNLGGDRHPIIPQQPFGTIEIPRIGLNHPIYEGVDLPDLHWGPGHWPGTAEPGQFGNAVFAGHRVTHTRPFLDIDRLVAGDQIIITTADGRFVYEVTGHLIVTPDDVHIADPTLTPTVTLLACHPKGSARQRYVVEGRLVG